MTEKITFAEAAKLGSTLLEPMGGDFFDTDDVKNATKGCLIGMALKAVSSNEYEEAFPQLREVKVKSPCRCPAYNCLMTMDTVVIHLFDDHIAPEQGYRDHSRWTIDRALQWAAKVERRHEKALARKAAKEAAKTKKTAANVAVALTRA